MRRMAGQEEQGKEGMGGDAVGINTAFTDSLLNKNWLVPIVDMELLDFLSFTAITTTFGLFLCGIPICRTISRKGSTDGISAAPFLLGTIGCFFWLRYGFLKGDSSVVTVNGVGTFLQVAYLLFYYQWSRSKRALNSQISVIALLTGAMIWYVSSEADHERAVQNLGLMCLTFNILNLGSPLAGLKDVIRMQSTENLPFPLCLANLLVSGQWFWYGILVNDPYIKIPNFVGIILAIIQLSLFIIYPNRRSHAT